MTEITSSNQIAPSIGSAQIELLERLSNVVAVTGDEREVRAIVLEELRGCSDAIKVDALGNVLVTHRSKVDGALRVMLAAHMDEVGFMLVDEDEDGCYQFEAIGNINACQLAAKPVLVGREHLPGVISVRPIHFYRTGEAHEALSVENLRIDLGAENGKRVKIGDRAAFATRFQQVGPSLTGKALDDRLGVAILIELVKHAPDNIELLAAFTVQEEIGQRGARVASYTLQPDLAIVIDCTPAYDLPTWDGSENTSYNSRLGLGPAIYISDIGTLSDPRLVRHMAITGDELGIPYQFRQPGGGKTDAAAIHNQRSGIPAVSVSVPGRYAHTPVMIARTQDWQATLDLLYHTLGRLSRDIFAADR